MVALKTWEESPSQPHARQLGVCRGDVGQDYGPVNGAPGEVGAGVVEDDRMGPGEESGNGDQSLLVTVQQSASKAGHGLPAR
jgi:hypothetical protein